MNALAWDDARAAEAREWAWWQLDAAQPPALTPAAADASSRRYFRIELPDGGSRIIMDAPGQPESVAAFVHVAGLLTAAGVHAPRVEAADQERGLLLLTDLGRRTYLQAFQDGADPQPLLDAAVNALVRAQAAVPVAGLPAYDTPRLRRELELFTDWYLPHCCGVAAAEARRRLGGGLDDLLERLAAQSRAFCHRDYMPRNLMDCAPLPGVLDFQDAVDGPVSYDAVSLVRDAFISWPREREVATLQRYHRLALEAGVPVPWAFELFWADCQWMGVQRHLKVLGIFARLAYRDGKPHYLADAPRFFKYLRAAAEEEPALRALVDEVRALAEAPGRVPDAKVD
ncbi:MAG: phosphotransferase [Halorhodospira halophila]|uniref:aminoglycoside phosphotransferase family protein n=1 Tax=Halorhodospira halophila TaxID=1053 RepID=UPI0026EEC942|nr:phosphotransferase [Halorhodospira halophila]MCC3751029.1 phosphotransferase [Halorhodospira halophila]